MKVLIMFKEIEILFSWIYTQGKTLDVLQRWAVDALAWFKAFDHVLFIKYAVRMFKK